MSGEPRTKRLYRVEILLYAWAEDADAAQEVVEEQLGPLDEYTVRIQETDAVDETWRDTYPFGGRGDQTCAQLLQAARAHAGLHLAARLEQAIHTDEEDPCGSI